jgi:hypothetical protein
MKIQKQLSFRMDRRDQAQDIRRSNDKRSSQNSTVVREREKARKGFTFDDFQELKRCCNNPKDLLPETHLFHNMVP